MLIEWVPAYPARPPRGFLRKVQIATDRAAAAHRRRTGVQRPSVATVYVTADNAIARVEITA